MEQVCANDLLACHPCQPIYMNSKGHFSYMDRWERRVFGSSCQGSIEFFHIFPVPHGESGQSCEVLEPEGHQYGAGPDF